MGTAMTPLHWVGVVALAAVAGAFGGGAVVWRASKPAPPRVAAETNLAAPAPDLAPRVATLEEAVSRLERRPRPALTAPVPSASAPAPSQSAAPPAPIVDDPVFEAAVRDVVQRLEDERESERQVQRQEQRQAAAARWAAGLVDRLHLNDPQKTKLEELARDYFERLRDAMSDPDAGPLPTQRERRTKLQALRTDSETKLGTILDGSQLSAYQKLDDDDKLGARGAWRGR